MCQNSFQLQKYQWWKGKSNSISNFNPYSPVGVRRMPSNGHPPASKSTSLKGRLPLCNVHGGQNPQSQTNLRQAPDPSNNFMTEATSMSQLTKSNIGNTLLLLTLEVRRNGILWLHSYIYTPSHCHWHAPPRLDKVLHYFMTSNLQSPKSNPKLSISGLFFHNVSL